MKICLINNLYTPFARGGTESIVEIIAHGLREAGHDVFIITTKPIFRARIKNSEFRIYYINGFYYNLSEMPKLFRIFWHLIDMFDIGSYWRVKFILKKENPGIVITHNLKGLGYLIPCAVKKLNIKHIHTLHDIQLLHPSGLLYHGKEKNIESLLAKIYQSFCRWLFYSPSAIISPSDWLAKIHVNKKFFSNSKITVISNPVKLPQSHLTRAEKRELFRFLYVGQIEEHKGILFLIKTFQLFCDEAGGEKCELIIVGDGSKIKKVLRLAKNQNNIKVLGFKNKGEVSQFMREADCLIVPSFCYENSPTVIYEAFAAELPIIASRLGGVPELLSGDAGILFEPENEGDLMYQMKWAINNKEKLLEKAVRGKEKVKEFDIKRYIKKIEKLF